ncbi:MAG: hypothetical protein HY047_16760 [Acidobacteria bacterium]|nr:hypothetical protein [Acidobacteriota bacterium]
MTTPAPGPTRAAFAFIFITVLLDMLALGVIIPVLPQLIVSFRGGDTASGAAMFGRFGVSLGSANRGPGARRGRRGIHDRAERPHRTARRHARRRLARDVGASRPDTI